MAHHKSFFDLVEQC